MKIHDGAKWVMIGDSITDSGRSQPVGEGLFDAHGKGYVALVNAALQAVSPEKRIRVVNMGSSGNTVRDLKSRWDRDVIDLKPDWVTIMIGINDVWRHFDTPLMSENLISPKEYEQTLDELVARTTSRVKGLILASPYMIEPNRSDEMRAQMDRYAKAMERVAGNHNALFVNIQTAFDRVLRHMHPMNLAWDRIHPTPTGHMIITRALLDAVGFSWNAP